MDLVTDKKLCSNLLCQKKLMAVLEITATLGA